MEPSLPTAVTHLQPLPLAQIAVYWTVKCYTFHLINTLNLISMVWELQEKMKQIYSVHEQRQPLRGGGNQQNCHGNAEMLSGAGGEPGEECRFAGHSWRCCLDLVRPAWWVMVSPQSLSCSPGAGWASHHPKLCPAMGTALSKPKSTRNDPVSLSTDD